MIDEIKGKNDEEPPGSGSPANIVHCASGNTDMDLYNLWRSRCASGGLVVNGARVCAVLCKRHP